MDPRVCPLCRNDVTVLSPTTIFCHTCTCMFTECRYSRDKGVLNGPRGISYIITGFASTSTYTLPRIIRDDIQLHAERISGQLPF